mmetsp:Transcript_12203/g.22521  ORF Transcript_12203/g.22521 Transcript_12203/m.22521 type:complete len:235 (-) Transcript_12203:470-1174(-)
MEPMICVLWGWRRRPIQWWSAHDWPSTSFLLSLFCRFLVTCCPWHVWCRPWRHSTRGGGPWCTPSSPATRAGRCWSRSCQICFCLWTPCTCSSGWWAVHDVGRSFSWNRWGSAEDRLTARSRFAPASAKPSKIMHSNYIGTFSGREVLNVKVAKTATGRWSSIRMGLRTSRHPSPRCRACTPASATIFTPAPTRRRRSHRDIVPCSVSKDAWRCSHAGLATRCRGSLAGWSGSP